LLKLHTGLHRFFPIVVEWTVSSLVVSGLTVPGLSVPGMAATRLAVPDLVAPSSVQVWLLHTGRSEDVFPTYSS
jgi:hypothetical protein